MRQVAIAILLMSAAFAAEELDLWPFGVAHYIAEQTESIFMARCPEGMYLPDDAACVHAPGSVLEATQAINALAAWDWLDGSWWVLTLNTTRSISVEDGVLWIAVRDGSTVLVRWDSPSTYDGVLIGVYQETEN